MCFTVTPSDKPALAFDCGYVNATGNASAKGFVYHMHGNDASQIFFEQEQNEGNVTHTIN